MSQKKPFTENLEPCFWRFCCSILKAPIVEQFRSKYAAIKWLWQASQAPAMVCYNLRKFFEDYVRTRTSTPMWLPCCAHFFFKYYASLRIPATSQNTMDTTSDTAMLQLFFHHLTGKTATHKAQKHTGAPICKLWKYKLLQFGHFYAKFYYNL